MLARIASDLEELNGRTERDFLAAGEKLAEFAAAARSLSSDMTALAELAGGEEVRLASHALTQTLKPLERARSEAEDGDRTLATVRCSAERVGRAFPGSGTWWRNFAC